MVGDEIASPLPPQSGQTAEGPITAGTRPLIAATVPRAGLWLAQTPQVFQRALILDLLQKLAHATPDLEVTDDAAVCEHFGQAVALIESSVTNLKITQPEDLAIADAWLEAGVV